MSDDEGNLSDLRICVEKSINPTGKYSAAFYKEKLWPQKSTVKIQFLTNPPMASEGMSSIALMWTPLSKLRKLTRTDGSKPVLDPLDLTIRSLSPVDAVKAVVKNRIQPMTNLNFVYVKSGGDVKIDFLPGSGAWSLLGTDCQKETGQTMNFGWLDCGTIIHEFGHVLGLIHEHQNPLGQGIQWDAQKVYTWASQTQGWDRETTDTNILDKYNKNQINGSAFDPYSIMLYFFPAELTTNNVGTDPNETLSLTDIEYITETYPGGSGLIGYSPTNRPSGPTGPVGPWVPPSSGYSGPSGPNGPTGFIGPTNDYPMSYNGGSNSNISTIAIVLICVFVSLGIVLLWILFNNKKVRKRLSNFFRKSKKSYK